ncbi:dimethylamine monooxygenase subunit DmmA family protein [Neobacillus sp. WH10]|uniref:dimethylamine monooxygenase subunit DmmA family protein n=1 Tax=Neobacillus sp. WH10 TaxID=3047873 RepID=UPI0024C1E4E1|nr:dimethylamine monooxygenase subunit DmmA family protein [Neobacillus sp. WH10]WHY79503.1 dimethylamine monooxygenase subunit DmmA family protein [Neobacillus sp. WH10]
MVYNSPVLFEKSETIVEKFTIRWDRRKLLIISAEPKEADIIEQFINDLNGLKEYELIEMKDELQFKNISEVLDRQKMGTQLYISAKWDDAVTIFTAAIDAGFSEDEIQTLISGKKRRYVYCIKCYHLQEVEAEDTDTICYHCQISLQIGPFFSRERKGYIGYPYNPAFVTST